jgi:hypothetical protein
MERNGRTIPTLGPVSQRVLFLSPSRWLFRSAEPGTSWYACSLTVSRSSWRTERVGTIPVSVPRLCYFCANFIRKTVGMIVPCSLRSGRPLSYVMSNRVLHTDYSLVYKIGINYSLHRDPRFHLNYCIGDAYKMADFLCGTAALLLQSM